MVPRWADPNADLTVSPDAQKRMGYKPYKKRKPQRKCGCGCGEFAGWRSTDTNGGPIGAPRQFIPGHHASKGGVVRMKIENEMAIEMAEAEARRLTEEFEAELDVLFAEATELGLSGNALIAHVYTVEMEQRAVRIQVRRAALDGSKDAANWLHGKKHGTGQGGAKGNAAKPSETKGFLDPLAVRDSPDDFDD